MNILTPERSVLDLLPNRYRQEPEIANWFRTVTSLEEDMVVYNFGQKMMKFPEKIEDSDAMKAALVSMGFVFEEKNRVAFVPQITEARYAFLLGVFDTAQTRRYIEDFSDYALKFVAITDRVFTDHNPDRTDWRKWMEACYGDIFNQTYWHSNQYSRSRLSGAVNYMRWACAYIGKNARNNVTLGNHERLELEAVVAGVLGISNELVERVAGKAAEWYDSLNAEKKLEVVRSNIDKVLEARQILAGDEAPKTVRLVT